MNQSPSGSNSETPTARWPREERYRQMIETAAEGIWELDSRWRTCFFNERLTEMLGYPPAELTNSHVLQFVFPEDRAQALEQMRQREAGERSVHDFRFRRRDGSVLWAMVSSRPFQDAQGRFAGVFAMLTDITARKLAEDKHARLIEALRAAHARTQALSQQLVRSREEESARIAREIHDELGQALTGLKLDLAWLERRLDRLPPSEVVTAMRARLQTMAQAVDATVLTTRRICTELRPGVLDDLGLVPAIEWQGREFQKRTRVAVELHLSDRVLRPDPACATAVFRIFQEALTNIARHAQARRVVVRLEEANGELQMEVRDDGCGFAPRETGETCSLGLLGMKERAAACGGTVLVQSAPGQGTVLQVRVPLQPPPSLNPPSVSA